MKIIFFYLILKNIINLWTCDDRDGPGFFKFLSKTYAKLNHNKNR